MSTLQPAELVRVSVHGPSGRADLAVPVSTTVADLLPVLLQYTGDGAGSSGELLSETDWVLQRVGGAALDVDGTPETLDWLEGEHFYLRPAAAAIPVMDFDDVADGLATAFAKQRDRWRPEFTSWLFVVAAAAAVLTAGAVIAMPGGPARLWTAVALTVLFAGAAVVSGRSGTDRVVVALFGVSACAFAWLAGTVAVRSAVVLAPDPVGGLVAGAAVAAVGGLLLGARASLARDIPFLPFGLAVLGGTTVAAGCGWHLTSDLTGVQLAALLSTFYLGVASYAPRVVLRMARLHGPQLPRTAEDLQVDIDPLPAGEVLERANSADRYLSVLMVVTFGVLATATVLLLDTEGWAPATLVALFALTSALRARVHLTVAQRLALAGGGIVPGALLVVQLASALEPAERGGVVLACLLGVAIAVTAAVRPPTRRPRPVWGHTANIVESLAMIAMLPVLLQVLHVYAWARGLAG